MKKLFFSLMAIVLTASSFGQANSKNPYDYAGRIHNDVVIQYLNLHKSSVTTTSELIQKVKIVSNQNNDFRNLKTENKTFPIASFLENGISDFKNNFTNTISNSGLSTQGRIEAQKFIDKMLLHAFNPNSTLQGTTSEILKSEDAILANSKLTSSDKEALLMSTSVMRYSSKLWNEQYSTDNSQTFASRGFWGWLGVAVGDAIGGFAGGGAFSVGTAITASTFVDKLLTAEEKSK